MRLQSASPMPVPPEASLCNRRKTPKIRSAYSGLIPMPLSATSRYSHLPRARRNVNTRRHLTAVFDRILNRILEEFQYMDGWHLDLGERVVCDDSVRVSN